MGNYRDRGMVRFTSNPRNNRDDVRGCCPDATKVEDEIRKMKDAGEEEPMAILTYDRHGTAVIEIQVSLSDTAQGGFEWADYSSEDTRSPDF